MSLKNIHPRYSQLAFERNAAVRLLCVVGAFACISGSAFCASLKDVPQGHWAKPAVEHVTAKHIMAAKNGKFDGNKPVTRYELAVTLDRLVQYIEQGKRPLHPDSRPKPVTVAPKAGAGVRNALARLVAGNFIPATSVLLKGSGSEPVTADQLSEILAGVTIRLSDRATPPHTD